MDNDLPPMKQLSIENLKKKMKGLIKKDNAGSYAVRMKELIPSKEYHQVVRAAQASSSEEEV